MPEKAIATRFGLIRHATTIWNLDKRIQGRLDSDLAPEGRQQARGWGQRLCGRGWQQLLASSSGRALKTARILNRSLKLPLSAEPRLQEQDWGRWSGLRLPDLKSEQGRLLKRQVNAGWHFRPPGGENRLDTWRRSRRALVDSAARKPGEHTLVVTHEGVIKCLLYRLSGRRFLPAEPPLLKPWHLHLLEVAEGKVRLLQINAFDLR